MRAAIALWLTLLLVQGDLVAGNFEDYFPLNSPSYGYEIDEYSAQWYGKQLAALDEPSLWNLANEGVDTHYRFLWLRSFHVPVSVRVLIRSANSADLYLKVTNGAGGYEPGHLIENRIVSLTKADIAQLTSAIARANFWRLVHDRDDCGRPLPVVEDLDANVVCVTTDGAQWIFEGAEHGQYHIVDRHSPGDDEFRKLCLLLLQLAQYSTGPVY